MKITLPITALAAVLGLALAGIPVTVHAAAADTAAAPAASTKDAAKKVKYSGILSAVDATANTITITDKTVAPKTFTVSPTTKIKKDGKPATLADFKVGDKVGGSYTTDATGKLDAVTLSSSTAAPKKEKAAKTAKAPAAPATTPAAQ